MKTINKIYNLIFSKINSLRYYIKEKILYTVVKKKSFKILKKEKPLISIVMPTYNRCKILSEICLPTVLNQTYKNFELIIVSDGSTDNTEEEIKKFNDKRIKFYKIIRKKRYPSNLDNHWACHSVVPTNFGLKKINGDWIAHIDDDDIWTEDHLEKLLDLAIKNKSEFVSSSYIVEKKNEKIIKNFKNETPPIGGVQTWLYISYLKFFKSNINCWRKKINKVNDLDLQDRMNRVGVKMSYLEDVTCIIKPRPGESEVGSKVYFENKDIYMEKYKFYD